MMVFQFRPSPLQSDNINPSNAIHKDIKKSEVPAKRLRFHIAAMRIESSYHHYSTTAPITSTGIIKFIYEAFARALPMTIWCGTGGSRALTHKPFTFTSATLKCEEKKTRICHTLQNNREQLVERCQPPINEFIAHRSNELP